MNRITPHMRDSDSTIDLARQIELDRAAVVRLARERQAAAERRCRWAMAKVLLGVAGLLMGCTWAMGAWLWQPGAALGWLVGGATAVAFGLMQSGLAE